MQKIISGKKYFLICVLILSLPIHINYDFIYHLKNIYISEIIFIILVITTFNLNYLKKAVKNLNSNDFIVLCWITSCFISLIFGSKYYFSFYDFFGYLYLVIVYFYVKSIFDRNDINYLIELFILSSLLCSIVGLSGYLAIILFENNNSLLHYEKYYPYFGEIYRIQSTMRSPSMMANFLLIGGSLSFAYFINNRKFYFLIIFLIIFSCFLLSLTKSIICFILSLSLIFILNLDLKRIFKLWLISITLLSLTSIYLLTTHFVFSFSEINIFNNNIFVVNENYYIIKIYNFDLFIYPSSYFYNKIASFNAFSSSYLFGIGPGNYNLYIEYLKKINMHPLNFPSWDPHSTFFGTLAENGIIGFIIIILFFYGFIKKSLTNLNSYKFINFAMLSILMGIIIDAFSLDIMKFRHLWIFFAFISLNFKKVD